MTRPVHVVIPGALDSRTGGYGYDRRVIAGLPAVGWTPVLVPLGAGFPDPSPAERTAAVAAFAALPDGAVVLVDGLAYAVLPEVLIAERDRLAIVALCHHPLALETGLDTATAAAFADSERAALAAARAVIVTSRLTGETLISSFGVPSGRITVAMPGTDPQPPAPAAGGADPVLLTVATLTRRKGHDLLIAALASLKHRRWTARFVGGDAFDPAWAAGLRQAVADAGLDDRVAFLGSLDDPTPEYQGADVFVLPSRYEGYGMVFAEALSHGLPIVAARAGAVPTVVPESAGLLVPPDDGSALADAIATLLDPDVRARYRVGAIAAGAALPRWHDTVALVAAALAGADR